MPRLIDYGDRFERMREAVFRVTLQAGPTTLSVATVAAEMGISQPTLRRLLASSEALPMLGMQYVARQRRYRRYNVVGLTLSDPDQAHALLEKELPLGQEQLEEELCWSRLCAAWPGERLQRLLDEEDDWRARVRQVALTALAVPEHALAAEHLRLAALLAGLSSMLCQGRCTAAEAGATLTRHLADLAAPPRDDVA